MSPLKLDYRVIKFFPNASEFLKGLTTNDLNAAENAFVDIKGRLIAAVFQVAVSDQHWILVRAPFVGRLKQHLSKYLAIADTRMEESGEWVYFWPSPVKPASNEPQVLIPHLNGSLLICGQADCLPAFTESAYHDLRLDYAWPLQGVDYDEEFILNVDSNRWVSYTKGCFLGQEVVARVHWKSRPVRRLVVRYESEVSPEDRRRMTSCRPDPRSGAMRGFLFESTGTGGGNGC